MPHRTEETFDIAKNLMDDFASRTGLKKDKGNAGQRYLWTDAFAVQTYFGMAHVYDDPSYADLALKLINLVHENLGKFDPDDVRKGWISGLNEEEGKKHPTIGGLRIGKKMSERKPDDFYNERLEWERDGQYFHYITRWIHALLQAEQETGEKKYAIWAAELLQASSNFLDKKDGDIRMYWKMSIDLSRPLIDSMGMHDPLEGYICTRRIMEAVPEKAEELLPLLNDFDILCSGKNWSTYDPLGIGGLMLNTVRAVKLNHKNDLPEELSPERLLAESLDGLEDYASIHRSDRPAHQRLAFRECGLSLGLRALYGSKQNFSESGLELQKLDKYLPLAEDIEDFWEYPENQKDSNWIHHLDINAVSLAASLVAKVYPFTF